jgi:hypothetical protein
VLAPALARDEEFVRRFSAEATAAAKVSHPNVVPIYFIGHDAEYHFFAMQFIEGQSLSQRLLSEKRLPVDDAVAIIEQCLAGLEAAHNQSLIHRDVKPGNILLERGSGRAVLVDFGLARHLNAGSRMTATGVVMGTVDYVAPEQAKGLAVDGRTDIYSLGVMFYELLSGRLPFQSDSATAMIFQHAYEKPFPLKRAAPNVPQPVIDIIAHMMAKEPDQRYPSCAAVLADLRAFREGRPVEAAPASSVGVAGKPDGAAVELPPQQASQRPATADVPDDEPAADWGSEYALPSENPLQRAKDWVATIFRRYAPQQLQEMQGTTMQMDAAVAEYERRRNRLARLLKEARGIEADLSEQIKAQSAAAAEAARDAEASIADHEKDAALARKCECEENAASLRSQLDVQRQEVEDLERQLSKADATSARLRSQQQMLKARLQAAEARRQMEGGLPEPKRRRWLVPMAIGTGVLALAALLLILPRYQPSAAKKLGIQTNAPPYAATKVDFVIGPHEFQPGDKIVIEEVWSELGSLSKGDVVTVKGTYTLASRPNAVFCFYVTQDSGDPPDHNPGITLPIEAGSAPFELKRRITCRGHLRLGFYDVQKGNAFGNVYFGTPAQMQEIAHWNLGNNGTTAQTTVAQSRGFPRDANLSEEQRQFRDWTEEYFAASLNQWQLQDLTASAKAAAEGDNLKRLSSNNGDTRISAISALAILGSKQAVPGLLHIAAERRQKDNRDRWMAIRALGFIGDPSVVPELVHLTYHYNKNVRLWAQISLVRLTGENFADDLPAWIRWWQLQGGTPPISDQRVDWKASGSVGASQPGPAQPNSQRDGVGLEGEWEATLPAGFTRRWSILHLDDTRYRVLKAGTLSGVYELRGDRLVMVEPDEKRLTEFVWQIKDSNSLVLIESPPVSKVGSDYRGAMLRRVHPSVEAAVAVSSKAQAFVAGNTPYWKTLEDMARRKGMTTGSSFNTQYDEYLPRAKGHVLLIETHDRIPIVPLSDLDRYYPGASEGLKNPDGIVNVENTTIVFVDFSRLLKDPIIDSAGVVLAGQQAFVNGNSLYLDTLADMAKKKGMSVVSKFNLRYDTWLPAAKGHVLLIETHDGIPTMPLSVLDEFYPGASAGLKTPQGIVSIENTIIVFADLSRLLSIPLDSH